MCLNSTPATNYYFFDTSLPAITEFGNTSLSVAVEAIFKCVPTYPIIPSSSSLRGAVGVDFSCIDSNEGIKKKKRTCLNWRCQQIHRQLKRAGTVHASNII